MLKITKEIADTLTILGTEKLGFFGEEGAVIGDDAKFVLVYQKDNIYLAHISEFRQEGVFVKLEEK